MGIADAMDARMKLIAQFSGHSKSPSPIRQATRWTLSTRTDSGATVGIDTIIPVLTTVSVASDNPDNTSLAKADDNVTLTVQSSKPLTALTLEQVGRQRSQNHESGRHGRHAVDPEPTSGGWRQWHV